MDPSTSSYESIFQWLDEHRPTKAIPVVIDVERVEKVARFAAPVAGFAAPIVAVLLGHPVPQLGTIASALAGVGALWWLAKNESKFTQGVLGMFGRGAAITQHQHDHIIDFSIAYPRAFETIAGWLKVNEAGQFTLREYEAVETAAKTMMQSLGHHNAGWVGMFLARLDQGEEARDRQEQALRLHGATQDAPSPSPGLRPARRL